VAKWHNPEIRQAKEMCFGGTVKIENGMNKRAGMILRSCQ
jgi:hypothetical protein